VRRLLTSRSPRRRRPAAEPGCEQPRTYAIYDLRGRHLRGSIVAVGAGRVAPSWAAAGEPLLAATTSTS